MKWLIILIVLAAVGVGAVVATHKAEKQDASKAKTDVIPYTDIRKEVKGKTAADVTKIVLMVMPGPGEITVTKKASITELLDGLRVAVRKKETIGCVGPTITIYWANGEKSFDYMFITNGGPDRAFGKKFAKAYNQLVPEPWQVRLNK